MNRKPRPVNITNPTTDGHCVVLHPLQPLRVVLPKDGPGEWQWSVHSDYVFFSGTIPGADKVELFFDQYFDLSDWAEQSVASLGEIYLWRQGHETESARNLLLVMTPCGPTPTTHTVVEPVGQEIRLSQFHLLEVVCIDRDPAECGAAYACTGAEESFLECLRTEVSPLDGPFRNDASLFRVLPRGSEWLPRNPHLPSPISPPRAAAGTPLRQHHFWFRVRPGAVVEEGVKLVFDNGIAPPCSVRVRPSRHKGGLEADSYRAASLRGLFGDYYNSESDRVVVNPKEIDVIELPESPAAAPEVTVEIAPPECFTPGTPGGWDHMVQTTAFWHGETRSDRLVGEKLQPRVVNGHEVSRYRLVSNVRELPPDVGSMYLGSIILAAANGFPGRRLAVWLNRQARQIISPPPLRPGRPRRHRAAVIPTTYVRPRREVVRVSVTEEFGAIDAGCTSLRYSAIPDGGSKKKRTAAVAERGGANRGHSRLLLVEEPRDGQVVVISPGQQAVITLPVPEEEELSEAVWFCTPVYEGFPRFCLHNQKMVGRKGRFSQQFVVDLIDPPCDPGEHLLGGLWLHNRNSRMALPVAARGGSHPPGLAEQEWRLAGSYLRNCFNLDRVRRSGTVVVNEPRDETVTVAPGGRLRLVMSPHMITADRGSTMCFPWSVLYYPKFLLPEPSDYDGGRQTFEFVAREDIGQAEDIVRLGVSGSRWANRSVNVRVLPGGRP